MQLPKRKVADNQTKARKKLRMQLKEGDSVYDQAAPYRLVTAKFPIDALTPEWSIGTNRSISESHKRRLCQIFKESGVLRRDVNHRLQVACSKAQVQQMIDHLKQKGSQALDAVGASENAREAGEEFLSFEDWSSVVGEKAELIAGNHRVEALKEYLQCSQLSEAERWWVCDIYDRDALPALLHIKLRANREDAILPDTHGQIWTELATLSSKNPTLFQDSNKVVEQQMLEHLGLSSRVKFPVRRLATLWKNKKWNMMSTKWCQFPIGQATFNISTFEWMASCRIDDFWFTAFDQVIEVVSQIRSQLGFDIQLTDWNKLADLPETHNRSAIQSLFFPDLESDAEPHSSSTRPRDFLSTISSDTYHRMYYLVLSEPAHRFVNIQALLRTTKQEGKLMSLVMSHVGQWMSQELARVADRDNNKPALRKDLLPGLQEKYGDYAEEKSIALQEKLLKYAQENFKDFTSAAMDHYLYEYPSKHGNAYTKRFERAVWRNLLSIVVEFVGPNLQHECMLQFNMEDHQEISLKPSSTIAQVACDLLCRIPEVTKNPALQSANAADKLYAMMQPMLFQWAAEQCDEALVRYRREWEPSTVNLVEAERTKFEALLEDLRLPSPRRSKRSVSPSAAPGNDVDQHRMRPHTHGSVEEHGPVKSNICGLTSGSNSATQPRAAGQLHDPVEMTIDTLKELRKLHRSKQNAPQQRHQLPEGRLLSSTDQQTSHEQPRAAHVIRSSGHWRQRAKATHMRQ